MTSTSPLMSFSLWDRSAMPSTPSWSRSNTPLLPVLQPVSEANPDDDCFQLGPAAIDVAIAGQANSSYFSTTTIVHAPELVTRNTFLELAQQHRHHRMDESGKIKRSVSEGTGLSLMEFSEGGECQQSSDSLCDSTGVGLGAVEWSRSISTSTGGDGPSEYCASESENVQGSEPSKASPSDAPAVQQYFWMPVGQASLQGCPQQPWRPANQASLQRAPQAYWLTSGQAPPYSSWGPSGPNGCHSLFGPLSKVERLHNRDLWS